MGCMGCPIAHSTMSAALHGKLKSQPKSFRCFAFGVAILLLNLAFLSYQMLRFDPLSGLSFHGYVFPSLSSLITLRVNDPLSSPLALANAMNQPFSLAAQWQQHQHVPDDENTSLADALRMHIRILCIIQTRRSFHATRAVHVKATWAKRCTHAFFVSDFPDSNLPAIDAGVGSEDKKFTWGKIKAAFRYANKILKLENFDWYLKCDDDAYVVVENLRYMVANFSPDEPIWFGKQFKAMVESTYMSGGPGYVLSREAVRRLVRFALMGDTTTYAPLYVHQTNSARHVFQGVDQRCPYEPDVGVEDLCMGLCLQSIGVRAVDSRDSKGRARFMAIGFDGFLMSSSTAASSGRFKNLIWDPKFWYSRYSLYMEQPGLDCCSDYPVGFHYMDVRHLYMIEFLLYHARPFGISRRESLPMIAAPHMTQPPTARQNNSIVPKNKRRLIKFVRSSTNITVTKGNT